MDDDIDIEEHDVLDNPKIRDIFPDLSVVKTEIPDVELQVEYDNPQTYPAALEYEAFNVKQEHLSDDENAPAHYEQQDETGQYEQNGQIQLNYQENVHNEPIYQIEQNVIGNYDQSHQIGFDEECEFSNKIILGSKPDYDTLYAEALNSTAVVYLENWELKLKESLCYCDECEILFPTVNALDAHNSTSHSFLVALDIHQNTARKSTVTTSSTYCNHCDRTFPNDTALITHLYELLPLNNFQKPTPSPSKIQYKCVKCKKYFLTYAEGKYHKRMAHPSLTNVNIIVKLVKTEKAISGVNNIEKDVSGEVKSETEICEVNKSKRELSGVMTKIGKMMKVSNLVPKSALFQCHVCEINFVSCYSAVQHSRTCENTAQYRKCNICKRKIRLTDVNRHEIQHKHTEKLTIYITHRHMCEKVLLKCPRCMICFDVKGFFFHEKTCDGTHVSFLRCNICCLNVYLPSFNHHKIKHLAKKYTKKDFTVVEFYDITQINEDIPYVSESDTDLYYCSVCGSYKSNLSRHAHGNGICKRMVIRFCEICGLGFGRYAFTHHKLVHSQQNLTLSDFKIFSLETGELMEAPISNFHCCKKCKIHFLRKDFVDSHKCETELFNVCDICNKKFNLQAFTVHQGFHTLQGFPELMEKYNSINNMWNLLYLCECCDVMAVSYDAAVEHSQEHIYQKEKWVTKSCEKCQMDFLENCYDSHMVLHENNKSINREQFTILKYNFECLFSTEWMTMLSTLPKPHKYQILSHSIYRFSRRFKMNCVSDSTTDDMKLYCIRCKTAVRMQDMKNHYLAKACKYSSKYICKTCELKFKTLHECVLHEAEHESTEKIYKVVTYNDQKDELFDQRLKDFELSMPKSLTKIISPKSDPNIQSIKPTKSSSPIPQIKSKSLSLKLKLKNLSNSKSKVKIGSKIKSGPRFKVPRGNSKKNLKHRSVTLSIEKENRFKLYKCEQCNSCVSLHKSLSKHCCVFKMNRKRLCKICKEYFYFRQLPLHMETHKMYPKINKKPLIISFNPSTKTTPTATIYQCECGLNFTSRQSIEKHLNICSENLNISKETCSKCNLLFPTDVLVSHLCKHHSKPVDINIQKVKNTHQGPYMCSSCKVIYKTIKNYEEHVFNCPSKTGHRCTKCKLLINNTLSDHICGQDITVVKCSAIASSIYRCKPCNICYLNKKSLSYHLEVKHVNFREIKTCNICNLPFTPLIFVKHNNSVHDDNENFIIKIIDAETNEIEIVKGRNYKLDFKPFNADKNSPKKYKQKLSTKNVDQKLSTKNIDQKLSTKNFDQETSVSEMIENNVSFGRVYKCTKCDVCYPEKRRWSYHIDVNHVMKHRRKILPCTKCGLKFPCVFMKPHMAVHEIFDNYSIEVIEPDIQKTTVVTGKNTTKNIKRKLNFVDNNLKIKKIKQDQFADQPSTSKSNFVDNKPAKKDVSDRKANVSKSNSAMNNTLSSRRAKKSEIFVDQEPSTSKIDFESVNMTDNETNLLSDIDGSADPLNSSTELILPDDHFADPQNISNKLKNMLNSKLHSYSNTLFKCERCSLNFITKQSVLCHIGRDCRSKHLRAYKCQLCAYEFTARTLSRHTYVHHIKMNLEKEHFHVQLVNEEVGNDVENVDHRKVTPKTKNNLIDENDKIIYYKCGDCNVCFVDENSCRRHCVSHDPLDPISYIQCKICNYQFLIEHLKKHMTFHHGTEFCIENVVITEYKASTDRNPKVDIYRGIDKLQSRLVSTTTDAPEGSGVDIFGM